MYFISYMKNNNDINHSYESKIIDFLKSEYGKDYSRDREFIAGLLLHLSGFEKRMKFKVWAKNPILNEIRRKYFYYFEMSMGFIRHFYGEVENIQEEVGLLALHFASADFRTEVNNKFKITVVCSVGLCSGRIIERMIQRNFYNEVSYIEVLTYREYEQRERIESDFVLSSIDISKKNKPIYIINSLPDCKELNKIIQKNKEIKVKSALPFDLFDERFFVSYKDRVGILI